jgi:hypothetical protein
MESVVWRPHPQSLETISCDLPKCWLGFNPYLDRFETFPSWGGRKMGDLNTKKRCFVMSTPD